ncbi:MAG: flagellar motor protein MotB [Burkholderiaceae bacterium]|nr:flagellar motor protein MotB [Burkholderiaceae bacterium]
MAGDAKKLQPIIVKKIKKGGHAAHGGAWKIAYADFVTAMMAFFLLMWLLGSTTEGDKKGIADYFQSPLKVAMFGGSGSGDSSSIIKGGGKDLSRETGQTKDGETPSPKRAINLKALKEEQRRAEISRLERLMQQVKDKVAQSPVLAAMSSQIRLDMTHEGLRIQIVDEQNRPMFSSGSAVVEPHMRELLRAIGSVLGEVPNRITLEGHTDAMVFAGEQRGYSNWELSADRANASRRELTAGGLPTNHMLRVQGLADSRPFDEQDPRAPANRRISIIVMNREAEDRFFDRATATEDVADTPALPSIRPDLAPHAQSPSSHGEDRR